MKLTQIFTSKKLEKIIREFIKEESKSSDVYLGDWNATVFYISRKKCWLLFNKMTKYFLILPDIKKSDVHNLSQIFKETFYTQLLCDGIIIDYDILDEMIGELTFHSTDNDRSANGSINNCNYYIEDWKYDFGEFDNMPFRALNSRLNSSPNKMLDWLFPKEKMHIVLNEYLNNR